jgi:GNAT superfamily N-acetyltransferase
MNTRIARRASALREFLSWRGLFIVGLLALREILRPLFYWHLWHIFETDISKQVPQPYGRDAVEVKFYAEDRPSAMVEQISAMGELGPEEVERRLARGVWIAIGWVEAQPAGYMWMSFSNTLELAFDTFWMVRPGEAVRYGSFVLPAFRGRGIHSWLNSAVNSGLRQRGIHKTLAAVSLLNPQSLSLPRHYRRAVVMTALVARVRGLNWTIRRSFGAPLGSRFSWPGEVSGANPESRSSGARMAQKR